MGYEIPETSKLAELHKKQVYRNEDFIMTWTIDENICDAIIKYFHDNPNLQGQGITYSGVDKNVKESTDLQIKADFFQEPFLSYRNQLQHCLNNYINKYPSLNRVARFNVTEPYNIQHYPIGGGFKDEHCERGGLFDKNVKRCLVFQTYLNDVDDGGTIFTYQNRKIRAIKGKTVIFPADWTHTHVGEISKTKEKTIITGWFSYLWDV